MTSEPVEVQDACHESPQELGDLVIEYLEQCGVDCIFGVPGGAIEPLYNALARSARRGGPRPVVARHEAGAAFMADGYARETGKLGVCCATTGPGATNLITGVASAFADSIPMLVVTAQTALPQFGKRALQDSSCTAVDTVGMFKHCTRYNTLVSHRGQLEGKLIAAIMAAIRSSGPAHISIPSDVLSAKRRMRGGFDLAAAGPEGLLQRPALVDIASLERLWEEVEQAKKIVLLVGSGCGGAMAEIMDFAEMVDAQVITGPQGKRWVNPYHPLYRGVYGFAGHESARKALEDEQVDLVLAVNTRLGETIICGGAEDTLLNGKLVHVDSVAEHFTRSPTARMHVCGHPQAVFEVLSRRLRKEGRRLEEDSVKLAVCESHKEAPDPLFPPGLTLNEKARCLADTVPLKPQRLIYELVRRFPAQTRYYSDAGNAWSWTTHYLHPRSSGNYHIGMGFGAMAWAIGASVGTAVGCKGAPVVCITGDGSYLMSGQEITVAVAEKLPVIYVVLNDRALGMVKHGQRLGGGEPIGFELPPVDFAQVARAMGAQAFSVRTPQDLAALDVEAICAHPGPTLLDVYIDGEEVPPMGARIKAMRGKKGA